MNFAQIDVEQAADMIEEGGVTVADVRDPESYAAGHIADAVSVGQENMREFLDSAPKDRPLLVYCYHGNSSQAAAQFFADNGFSEVYSLLGGFEEWRIDKPFETASSTSE